MEGRRTLSKSARKAPPKAVPTDKQDKGAGSVQRGRQEDFLEEVPLEPRPGPGRMWGPGIPDEGQAGISQGWGAPGTRPGAGGQRLRTRRARGRSDGAGEARSSEQGLAVHSGQEALGA